MVKQYSGPKNGAQGRSVQPESTVTDEASTWYAHVPELLREQSLSIRQLETKLREKDVRAAYSTIYTWMKRAVERGDYAKKGTRYRLKPKHEEHAT